MKIAQFFAATSALALLLAIVELAQHRLVGKVGTALRELRRFASRPGSATLTARLAAAGEPARLERGWLGLKVAGAAVGALAVLPIAASAPGRLAPLLLPAGPAAGFVAPEVWLARRSRARVAQALEELPDMLDLLRVTVEAGLAPARALGEVGRQFSGSLALEWRSVAAEVALGSPQDEAVGALARRLPAEEIASLVETLTRARRHGAPLAAALAGQASRARHRRAQQLRERAAQAGPKIQLVVALLLVPSVLLLVAAGLVAELGDGGLFPLA
jgi:tight adherence protein C